MVEKENKGCWKIAKFGCLSVLVCAALILVIGTVFREEIARKGGAAVLEFAAKAVVLDTNLPQKEQEALLAPIQELASDIREDRITQAELKKVAEEAFKPETLAAVGVPIFKAKYLNPSGLSDAEKQSGAVDLERFATGITENKIPKDAREQITLMLTEEQRNAYGSRQNRAMKKTLTDAELRDALKLMRESSDRANVSHKPFNLDPAKAIRDAIARGKAK